VVPDRNNSHFASTSPLALQTTNWRRKVYHVADVITREQISQTFPLHNCILVLQAIKAVSCLQCQGTGRYKMGLNTVGHCKQLTASVNTLGLQPCGKLYKKGFRDPSSGTATHVSTICLPDVTTHGQISQAFLLCIWILQVIKYWGWEWPGNEGT